jgi:hypothetical protein
LGPIYQHRICANPTQGQQKRTPRANVPRDKRDAQSILPGAPATPCGKQPRNLLSQELVTGVAHVAASCAGRCACCSQFGRCACCSQFGRCACCACCSMLRMLPACCACCRHAACEAATMPATPTPRSVAGARRPLHCQIVGIPGGAIAPISKIVKIPGGAIA